MYNSNDPEEVVTGCLTSIIITQIILAGIILGSVAIYKHYTENNVN